MLFERVAEALTRRRHHFEALAIHIYIFFNNSGPATGIVAGSKIPNYCVMGDTAAIARVMEKMGEGMRIHISSSSKELLEKIGGYRYDHPLVGNLPGLFILK